LAKTDPSERSDGTRQERLTGVLALVLPVVQAVLHAHATDSRAKSIVLVLAKCGEALLDDSRRHRNGDGALQHELFKKLTIVVPSIPALGSLAATAGALVGDALAAIAMASQFSHRRIDERYSH